MTHRTHQAVSLERLAQLLDAYGGEPSRWPDAERSAALRLIETDPRAHEMHAEATALDAALDLRELSPFSELSDVASAQLRARVLEIPIRHARGAATLPRFGWKLVLLALTPCVLGFLSGTLLMDPAPTSDEDNWDELAQVVMPVTVTDELNLFDEDLP